MSGIESCNANCVYCSAPYTKSTLIKQPLQIDHEAFETAIRNHPDFNTDEPYVIWGADPLSHFESIEYVIDFIRNIQPNAVIATSTNGIPLKNKEVVDFINENKILLQLSHDGIAEELKLPFDPLKEYPNNINKIDNLEINCVNNFYNYDIPENIKYFNMYLDKKYHVRFSKPAFGRNYSNRINTKGFFNGKYFNEFKGKPFGNMNIHNTKEHPDVVDTYLGYIYGLYNTNSRFYFHISIDKWLIDVRKDKRVTPCIENTIDTLGRKCECNLSLKVANPERIRPNYCNGCKYRYSSICGLCGVNEIDLEQCEFHYKLNQLLEAIQPSKLV